MNVSVWLASFISRFCWFLLIAEICVEIYGIALREGVDETCDRAEGHAKTAAECLLGPILFSHVIDYGPGDTADTEEKQKVSSPFDDLSDAITEGLIVSAEDGAARRSLSHCANGC